MSEWKPEIIDEKSGQIIRIFRPPEIHALINVSDVRMETRYKFLQSHGITTEDVKAWFNFLLYTGSRVAEGMIVHPDSSLYDGRGILRIPNYKGKELREMKARNIFLSNKGRDYMKPFFESSQMPSEDYDEIRQSMRALTTIMHEAGKAIGLSDRKYELRYKKSVRDENDKIVMTRVTKTDVRWDSNRNPTLIPREVTVPKTENATKPYITNGCVLRSFRHTWESWLYWALGDKGNTTVSQIVLSQGHKQGTSMKHYLNFGFDRQEDLKQIIEEVSGFGEVG